ncbi:MAG TPA: energy-coupling factor transporter transmembrane component T [Candidatus Lokiarchaeia archaeon]|nr:energy-coupling factor transporter transmembrane component T [Candidatus Lokiarchaeia archaeon]
MERRLEKVIFRYEPGQSFLHRLHPMTKLAWVMLTSIAVLFIPSLLLLAIVGVCLFGIATTAGISFRMLFRQLRWILLFTLLVVPIDVLFNAIPNVQTEILFYIIPPDFLPVRRIAVYYAFRGALWIICLATCSVVFSLTTHPRDLVYGFMSIGIPYRFCFALMVGFRYIPRIQEESATIEVAQKLRGVELTRQVGFKRVYNSIKERLTTILIAILRRAETTSISMEKRGFGFSSKRTNRIQVQFHGRDVFFLILVGTGIVFLILYLNQLVPLPPMPSIYHLFYG